jgi:hypothetical protein
MNNSDTSDGIIESVQVVTSTRDISYESMLDTLTWSSYIHTMHVGGMTTFVARYLYKAHNVDYPDFYDGLYDHLQQDPWWRNELTTIRSLYQEWFDNGRLPDLAVGGAEIFGWNLYGRLIMVLHCQGHIDDFYDLFEQYLQERWTIPLLPELLDFQRQTIVEYQSLKSYPIVKESHYDFHGYLINDEQLESPCRYEFDTLENKLMEQSLFLKQFHYGRKRNFGKTRIRKLTQSMLELLEDGTIENSRQS